MTDKGLNLISESDKCSCKGSNLDKFLQPAILSLLAKKNLNGYLIIQELEDRNFSKQEKVDSLYL